jgi:hypothetical protein
MPPAATEPTATSPTSPTPHRAGRFEAAAAPGRQAGFDARGCAVTGATPTALALFERALAAYQAWRGGADALVERAVAEAPGFVMAHVLQAWLRATGRDPRRVRQARAPLARAVEARPALPRERLHVAALTAALDDDYPRAKARLGELLQGFAHDVLALQVAHSLDYLTGDLERLGDRVPQVLPAWDRAQPGFHALLAMQAFGLVERGEVDAAEVAAHAALALNPLDARAHHVMAHVFDARGHAAEGVRWLERHAGAWRTSRMVATHCAWHLALFHLELGEPGRALALHDRHIDAVRSGDIADLIDASALLWRVQLQGHDVGDRFRALAAAWAPRIDERFCSFSDVHAMLAFVGAGDGPRVQQLLRSLEAAHARPTRHGATTRQLGLPACRALAAFGQGRYTAAIEGLAGLPAEAHRLGGSHAQRDVLHLTLLHAVQRIRRPAALPIQAPGRPIGGRRSAGGAPASPWQPRAGPVGRGASAR